MFRGKETIMPIQIGEWSPLFKDYHRLPYSSQSDRFCQKVIKAQAEDRLVGFVELNWFRDNNLFVPDGKVIYFDGQQEQVITSSTITSRQNFDENLLIGIDRWVPVLRKRELGFPLSLRFPSGQIYQQVPTGCWINLETGEEFTDIKIASNNRALSQTQAMFKEVQF